MRLTRRPAGEEYRDIETRAAGIAERSDRDLVVGAVEKRFVSHGRIAIVLLAVKYRTRAARRDVSATCRQQLELVGLAAHADYHRTSALREPTRAPVRGARP